MSRPLDFPSIDKMKAKYVPRSQTQEAIFFNNTYDNKKIEMFQE